MNDELNLSYIEQGKDSTAIMEDFFLYVAYRE